MSQSIIPFDFNSHTVRIVMRDGNPWFVAKDVMDALDYAETSNPARVTEHIPSEWKGVNPIHTLGGEQKLLCLAEPGLYFFLGRSDKPKALPFQKWLAGEVLPSIRKTGSYVSNDTVSLTTVRRCGTVAPALANSSAGFGNPMNGASRAPRIPSGAFCCLPQFTMGQSGRPQGLPVHAQAPFPVCQSCLSHHHGVWQRLVMGFPLERRPAPCIAPFLRPLIFPTYP